MLKFWIVSVFVFLYEIHHAESVPCVAAGDPYYTTFDYQHIDFQGKCKYILTEYEDVPYKGLAEFKVIVENKQAPHDSTRSYTERVLIEYGLHIVKLHESGVIIIDDNVKNGAVVTAGLNGYNVKSDGSFVVYRSDNNIVDVHISGALFLRWDARGPLGRHVLSVSMTSFDYQGLLKGICGNFDNNAANDLWPKGLTSAGTGTEIGNSWGDGTDECM